MFCTEKSCETCVDWSRVHNKCMDAFHPNVNTETKGNGECHYYERRREAVCNIAFPKSTREEY